MPHQLNVFILLFGALQGFLLSFWFLKNSRDKWANWWFGLFLFVIGLQLTVKVITKSWLIEHALIPYKLHYTLPYLVGPLLFLYIRARGQKTFRYRSLLHLLPFIFFTGLSFISLRRLGLPFNYFHPYLQAAFQLLLLGIYGFLSFRHCQPPLRRFVGLGVAAEAVVAVVLGIMVMYNLSLPDLRLVFVLLTLLIYWVSYKIVASSDFFISAEPLPDVSLNIGKTKKYAHSSLKPGEARRIEDELRQLMDQQKEFLNPSLTLDALAERLGTSRHNLSQYLNETLQKSYFDYINDLRLEEARTRLSGPFHQRFTIAAIALDSGFNSVSNFNDVFKKKYGITPSKFREQSLKQMSA